MDRLFAMTAFEKIAELRSFTAAATALGTTKGNVSRSIKALEESLGTALLNRTTRRISLTEAGRLYRERCARALAEVEAATTAVRQLHTEPRGRLRMSAPVGIGQLVIAPAIPSFLRHFPELQLDLVLTNRTVDLVEEAFDLCVLVGSNPPLHLVARKLATFRWIACAAPTYIEAAGEPRHPRDLEGHSLLSTEPNQEHEIWRFRGSGGEIRVSAAGLFRVNNVEALAAAARAGAGIALVPSYTVDRALREGQLREILPDWRPIVQSGDSIWAEFSPGRRTLPKVRAMLDFLDRNFAAPTWPRDTAIAPDRPAQPSSSHS